MFTLRQFLLGCMVFCLTITLSTVASASIIPLEDIKSGMQGYGKTVFSGYDVTSFPVEVKGILQEGYQRHLILIRASGSDIERIGGIASGMSGSPVYLDGKLAGAIAYGWNLSDHRYALVTPIEEMLELWDSRSFSAHQDQELDLAGLGFDHLTVDAVKTPLMTMGFSGRALDYLNKELEPFGIKTLSGVSPRPMEREEGEDVILPGSAVGVDLMRGDLALSFIGTVTAVEDDKVLAFGHPLFNAGNVELFLSHAYIHDIIPSMSFPFKLGAPLELLGMISVDRGAGVAGKIDEFPSLLPINISVRDEDRGERNRALLHIVRDERLTPGLVNSAVLQLLDETLDRIGPGTAWVKMELMGDGLPHRKLVRENVYHSHQDIAYRSLDELYSLLAVLVTNPYQKVDFYNIRVDIRVEERNSLAYIQALEIPDGPYYPGEEITAEVILRPYRQEPMSREVQFTIPKDIPLGGASLLVSGGPSYYYVPSPEENDNGYEYYHLYFEEFLEDFAMRPMNNQIIIEILPYNVRELEELEEGQEPWDVELKKLVDTEFVLDGFWSQEIEIEDPEAPGEE